MSENFHGLTQAEADKRLKEDGLNEVPEPEYNFFKELLVICKYEGVTRQKKKP